ncbi:uncharacterized protein [Henckelia pumila]|uniref:uncharacterized protein n=1 Tax=Henckelia pumila TaxID=405737 RepID=UPI003C6E19F1
MVLTLTVEDDYTKFWNNGVLTIDTFAICFSKWTPEFKFEAESPIASIWVRLPDLPLHLYNKSSLYAIARCLGNPVKIDVVTEEGSRGSFAHLCVELDVTKERPSYLWVGWGDHRHSIEVVYEKIHFFCLDCKVLGHSSDHCYRHGKNPRPAKNRTQGAAGPLLHRSLLRTPVLV